MTSSLLSLKSLFPRLRTDTISKWIVAVIRAAGPTALTSRVSLRAHDTRSVSTSWALFSGVSVEEIHKAAYWRSPNSFISFYLRDFPAAEPSLSRAALAAKHLPVFVSLYHNLSHIYYANRRIFSITISTRFPAVRRSLTGATPAGTGLKNNRDDSRLARSGGASPECTVHYNEGKMNSAGEFQPKKKHKNVLVKTTKNLLKSKINTKANKCKTQSHLIGRKMKQISTNTELDGNSNWVQKMATKRQEVPKRQQGERPSSR